MSKNLNVKIIAVFALLITGAHLAGLVQLDNDTKMIAGEELKALCTEHLVDSNFNFFESLKNQIVNYSYNSLNTSDLYVILKKKFQKIEKKLNAVTILQKNLEYVLNVKICYRSAPVDNISEQDKLSFKKLIGNKTKSNCIKFDDPIFIDRLSRNNLVFNINLIISKIDLRRKLLNPKTPLYKFVLEGLTIFNKEISNTNNYEMDEYEYYLLELYKNNQKVSNTETDHNNLVTEALGTHMVDYDLGDYACDLYETVLFTFTEYCNTEKINDEEGFGQSLDKYRANFEFISKLQRFDKLTNKFRGPLCGNSPKSDMRISGLILDNLKMSVHDYFLIHVLDIKKFVVEGDIDKTILIEYLYDYNIDSGDDVIDFWDFGLCHKGIEEITTLDFSFLEFFTHYKKGLEDENVFISSQIYRKMNLDAKKGEIYHFDYKIFQMLSKYFKIFIEEFKGDNEFSKFDYDYMIFESVKLIYKVYTFLRYEKVIIKKETTKVVIEKILKFFLDRDNFENFQNYFDEAEDEIQRFFVISYTYLLRIYFIEFLGLKDNSKFNELLEQKKKEISVFYNEDKLSKMDNDYFTFDYLIILVKIVKITIFKKIYTKINSIKLIQELHETEPELELEIEKNWNKKNSRVQNRRAVYKQSFTTESKPKIQKIINEDVTQDDIKYIFNFIKQKKGKEIKIPLKRIIMRNLLLKTEEKRNKIYLEIKNDVLIELYSELTYRSTEIEYFIQFLDWLRKTNPPQFYGNLYKNTDFSPQFTTVLLADFHFIVPKCLQIMANLENSKLASNPSYKKNKIVGNCSEENFAECKSQAYWLLGNDFHPDELIKYEAVFDLKLYDYMEQLTFLIHMLPIFKHFRIVLSENIHKYNNEVREIFRDIYSFMISLRAHMYVVDDSPWETLFDGLEECLEFTYSRHFDSQSESVNMCNFSYQRYSEMYWFLKYFQMEETSNDDLFFHLFSDKKREEILKKADKDLTLEDKKLYYPQFTSINCFHIFLSYIVDVQKLPKAASSSNDRSEESAKSRILKACENQDQKKYMFCRVLNSVLTIRGELLGEESSDSYNLILQTIKSQQDAKFVIWNSISILHDLSLYRGLDYFEKLNISHDNFFSVDFFYENKQRKVAFDPIFTIEKNDMIGYVDYIKMKYKPSPGFLHDYIFIYEVVKEIITKHKTTHLNQLFYMTEDNIAMEGVMGIGESVSIFLMFCDTDAFYTELAQKLVKVPDYVLYDIKQKADIYIPPLNSRLAAVGNDMAEKIRVFLEYFPARLNKKIEVVNPAFAKLQGMKDSIATTQVINIPKLVIRKKGGVKKQILQKGEIKASIKKNIDFVAQDKTLKIEGSMTLKNFDSSSLMSKLKSGKSESINESEFETSETKTFVIQNIHKFVNTSPNQIPDILLDGGMTTNQAIIRQSFKSMPNNTVKSGLIEEMFKSRSYSETKIIKESEVVIEKNIEMMVVRESIVGGVVTSGKSSNIKILKKKLLI